MSAVQGRPGLIISLDFELYWGVRDHLPLAAYRENLLGVRQAAPALLELFRAHEVHATWATVGFLFCSGREELLASLPARRPRYRDPRLSPYSHLDRLGRNETEDPFHFAPSLIRQIAAAPHQEIGTHTLSHYCCLEPEQDLDAFRADLGAAMALAAKSGITLRSLVFPRNQYSPQYIAVAGDMGITAYRGIENSWGYRGLGQQNESYARRLTRFADAHLDLSGAHSFALESQAPPRNLPASHLLRPWSRGPLARLRLRRILNGLEHAAKNGLLYHLWWHPHNFGVNLSQNLDGLERILELYAVLRQRDGMESMNMGEAAERAAAAPAGSALPA